LLDHQQIIEMSLPDLIKWWIDQKPARNFSTLARGSGIHRTSLNRYLEDSKAQYQKAKQLVCYMFRSEKNLAFLWLEKHYEEAVKADFSFYQYHNLESKNEFVDEQFQSYLKNPNTFRMVHLAGTIGITRKQVEQSHGQYGLKYLDELVESGILSSHEGRYKTIVDDWSVNNYDTVISELENVTSLMRQQGEAHVFMNSIALNEEGVLKAKELQQKFLTDLGTIKEDFKGDQALLLGTFLTKLD
jgi:hypothetical protein